MMELDTNLQQLQGFPQDLISLFETDEKICSITQRIVNKWLTCDSRSVKHQKARREEINFSGSCAEGGMVSRFFSQFFDLITGMGQYSNYHVDGINREAEMDMEYTLLELTPDMKDFVVDIPEKPGYARLREHPGYLKNARSIGWDVSKYYRYEWEKIVTGIFYEDGYIRIHQIKAFFANKVGAGMADERLKECFKSLIAGVLKKCRDDVTITVAMLRTNATTESIIRIESSSEKLFKISYDSVPMIRLQWWPDVAKEWKERQRVWPSDSAIQELTKFGYLIGKPNKKGDRNATDMRYAFSHVERKLVNMRNKRQKMIYLIFKTIWVKHVKPLNPDKISSFMAKNIMFWVCEEIQPNDIWWWKQDYTDILKDLFKRMLDAFEKCFLPYYFIPHINVLITVPEELMEDKVKPQIEKIILNIDDYVPKSFDHIISFAKTILETFDQVCQALDEFENRDYHFILKQPELIVRHFSYLIPEVDMKYLLKIRKHLLEKESSHLDLTTTNSDEVYFISDEVCERLVARWKDIVEQKISIRNVIRGKHLSKKCWTRHFKCT